jgi:acyl-CoA synthetase (AMP-forming)/AMP-acid ligase II
MNQEKGQEGRWPLHLATRPISAWKAQGQWAGATVADYARRIAADSPDRVMVIDNGTPVRAGRLMQDAVALAAGLRGAGIGRGDVISFQLPNWYEASVINLAAVLIGAVVNPLVPIYRDAEVGFMMRDCGSRVVFIPAAFRRHDYVAMLQRLRPGLPDLRAVVVLRGDPGPFTAWADMLAADAVAEDSAADPDAVKLIMYTSGTTGPAKGVLHSHNTLLCEMRALDARWGVRPDDAMFMPSPVSHITGCTLGLDFPWVYGIPAVFMDTWSGARAVQEVRAHRATLSVGATPFLRELLDAAKAANDRLPGFRMFCCGGAAIPADLMHEALDWFEDAIVCRVYGSTEAPTVTLGPASREDRITCAETDGEVWNTEVRIADAATGETLGRNREGEILVRGPELFLGYARAEDNATAFDADGYFRTGDLGVLTDTDRIVVTGRKKDLIIRGGENISPKEIEDVLLRHADVAEVAVVGMPHARLGEAVCAFVVPRANAHPGPAQLTAWLRDAGMAPQKWPERVEIVDELPRTASGKVRKNLLRDQVAAASQ